MADKAWKATERKIASILGGERIPVTGRERGAAADIKHDWLVPEVKHRESVPQWIREAMSQAKLSVRGLKLPIVVLHEARTEWQRNLVIIELEDFVDWFLSKGNPKEGSDDHRR